jgi:hypothetical protein
MSEVALVGHNAIPIVVKMPASLSLEFVVQSLALALLILLRILECRHHHHVLVCHWFLVMNLVVLLADGARVARVIVWLITSSNLRSTVSSNVCAVVCRVI